jgi:hypothetical protein
VVYRLLLFRLKGRFLSRSNSELTTMNQRSFRSDMLQLIRSGVVYLIVISYFLQWSAKKEMSKLFRLAAWSFLSVSTLSLAAEVAVEMEGPTKAALALKYVLSAAHKIPASVILTACALSALYLIAHHYREARKPSYEFGFAMGLYECLNGERFYPNDNRAQLVRSLELIYSVFKRAGAKHVCLHLPDAEKKEMKNSVENFFPPITDAGYCITLKRGEGVAGRVWQDKKVRYVPRLRLAWMAFPHAVPFDYEELQHPLASGAKHQFIERRPDFFVFESRSKLDSDYRALLSIPVRPPGADECSAVLNIEFERTDPIGKEDILMASTFGVMLADVLTAQVIA